MKSGASNRPAQIVKGNVFDALGFSASEASALKIKAEILSAILEQVRGKGYTQAQLVDILDEYQPSVSNLLKGRISQVSIEKLLRYADRLHLQTSIAVRPVEGRSLRVKTRPTADTRPARVKSTDGTGTFTGLLRRRSIKVSDPSVRETRRAHHDPRQRRA